MGHGRPFRIMMVDDTAWDSLSGKDAAGVNDRLRKSVSDPYNHTWLLGRLADLGRRSAGLELYLSISVDLCTGTVRSICPLESAFAGFAADASDEKIFGFYNSLDVLILDLSDVTCGRISWKLNIADLPAGNTSDINRLNKDFFGAAFYIKYHKRLAGCQLVLIVSQHDAQFPVATPDLIRKYLDPLCKPDSEPHTLKFSTAESSIRHCYDMISSAFADFSDGFRLLRGRGPIEFAASHDLPVLIVGETGTGKEGVARAIHRRWRQEVIRKSGIDAQMLPEAPMIVNCGSLSPELARAELFGAVKGSFTGCDRHSLGHFLRACGINAISTPRTPTGYAEIKKSMTAFNKLQADFEKYSSLVASNGDKARELLLSRVVPALSECLLGHEYHDSVLAVLGRVGRELDRAGGTKDYADEYRDRLLECNPDRFDSDGEYNLRLRGEGPIGTLFLDEFGDLPGDVQVLLLRYLDSRSREVQPLGYPGQIANVTTRVIVASSDPRIARFAGERLQGSWRSESELMRPLRQDLLERVKGYVIRTEGFTESNVEHWMEFLLSSYASVRWSQSAKQCVIEQIKETLKTISGREKAREERRLTDGTLPVFGHMRELEYVIRRVDAYVSGWTERGFRDPPSEVTPEIVKKLWKPSFMLASDVQSKYYRGTTGATEDLGERGEGSGGEDRTGNGHERALLRAREGFQTALDSYPSGSSDDQMRVVWVSEAAKRISHLWVSDRDAGCKPLQFAATVEERQRTIAAARDPGQEFTGDLFRAVILALMWVSMRNWRTELQDGTPRTLAKCQFTTSLAEFWRLKPAGARTRFGKELQGLLKKLDIDAAVSKDGSIRQEEVYRALCRDSTLVRSGEMVLGKTLGEAIGGVDASSRE